MLVWRRGLSSRGIVRVVEDTAFRVCLVGRPNVGKSTLFNKMVGRAHAMVHPTPGLTRDWQASRASFAGREFTVIDSPGAEKQSELEGQVADAVRGSDLVLLMGDVRAGLGEEEVGIARWLQRRRLPCMLVLNKCDGGFEEVPDDQLSRIGIQEVAHISAETNIGISGLLHSLVPLIDAHDEQRKRGGQEQGTWDGSAASQEAVVREERGDDAVEGEEEEEEGEDEKVAPMRLVVIGRPNVGKSTLINTLLGYDRLLAGSTPGLTRDAVEFPCEWQGRPLLLADTAGLRRRIVTARGGDRPDVMSRLDTWRSITFCNVAVLLTEATGESPLSREELNVCRRVLEEGRGLVLGLNKMDALPQAKRKEVLRDVRTILHSSLRQAEGIELVPMSGLRGQGTQDLMEACFRVFDRWRRRVPTPVLNRFVRALQQVPDRCPNGFKVTFITQVSARPPTFAAFAPTRGLHDHMQRFLVRALREEFDLLGVPVRLVVRDKTTPGDVRKKRAVPGGDSSKKHRAAHRRRRVGKALQKK